MKVFPTFIQGFDDAVEGGIPQGHIVLLSGPPGTMKSSLAYSLLYHNALANGTPGMYLTLEQARASIEYQMMRMGYQPQRVAGRVRIEDLSKIRRGVEAARGRARFGAEPERPWMEVMQKHVQDLKAAANFELLVLDSLPVLEIIGGVKERRVAFFHLFGWLRELGVTALLISEVTPDPDHVREEDFLADGLIHLTMERVGDVDVYRRIRCVKMRGVNHDTSIFTLEFREGGFRVQEVI